MEGFLVLWIFEIAILSAGTALEKARRKKIIGKWTKGELTMKELLWLKRQPWFQKVFTKIDIDITKKND